MSEKKAHNMKNSMKKVKLLAATLVLTLGLALHVRADGGDASVSLGKDGKLTYTPDERGNLIPDFSQCGYMGGGVRLPDLPVKLILSPRRGMEKEMEQYTTKGAGEGDDTERIQAAIDRVGAMPLDKNGFRGALLLKRGLYRVEGVLSIKASGVVLRGEGQGKNGTIILGTGKTKRTLVIAQGQRKISEVTGSRREIADTYVPWGVRSFHLKSASGLSVGDKVVVFRPFTDQWFKDIGMSKWINDKPLHGRPFKFERVITAIDRNRITLDAPTVNAMEGKYGGGFVYKYKEQGAISQVGIEHMRLISAYDLKNPNDEAHGWDAVNVNGCVDSWVRNITAVHFGFACVQVRSHSKFITVQDCSYLKPISKSAGGRRYPFQFDDAQFSLFQRCYSERGRHSNSCSAAVRGPNVWLDMVNDGHDVGPHHRWAMGILYDNVSGGFFIAPDRRRYGNHGYAGAQIVFWNGFGYKLGLAQPPTARNYSFGFSSSKGKKDESAKPRSLYLQQLEERLGKTAVENITTENQRKALTDLKSEHWRKKILWDPIRFGIGEKSSAK